MPKEFTCSFCHESIKFAQRLFDGRIRCAACKPIHFFEQHLSLVGDYSHDKFTWMPVWRQIFRDLYGTLDEDGNRIYDSAWIEIAKGNAKTLHAAGLCVYELATAPQPGTEIYSAATAKEQAANIYRAAEQMVLRSARLNRLLKCLPSTKRIVRRDDPTSYYAALSSDGKVSDGCAPSILVRDELHLWNKKAHIDLFEHLERSARVKRKHPIIIDITTAGREDESPVAWPRHTYARRVISGALIDRTFYAKIFSADHDRIVNEPEYWASKEARLAANPAHEELGGFIKEKILLKMVEVAQNDNSRKAKFLRLHLNFWGAGSQDSAIKPEIWVQCSGGIDMRTWDKYNVYDAMSKWGLAERECYLGIDIGVSRDLTALAAVFPPITDGGEWSFLVWFWMPERSIKERENIDKQPYQEWVDKGFITATPTYRMNPRDIIKQIKFCREMFDVTEICYDPHNAYQLVQDLEEEDFPCVEVKQFEPQLSGPTKWLLSAYLDKEIRHGNNPVLNFNAFCLAVKMGQSGGMKPIKPREDASKKIDGIAAIVTALHRALGAHEDVIRYTGLKSVGGGS